jgi:hypothetical protein
MKSLALQIAVTLCTAQAINSGFYPPLDAVAPGNAEFMRLYDFSKVPNAPRTTPNNAVSSPNCENANYCSWGCTKCTRPNDVIACPNPNDWAMTLDDGNTKLIQGHHNIQLQRLISFNLEISKLHSLSLEHKHLNTQR